MEDAGTISSDLSCTGLQAMGLAWAASQRAFRPGRLLVVDVDAYLARIGLSSRPRVDLDGLEQLQRAHLTAVPFENLDVYQRRGVHTGIEWSVPKIVSRGRGGWCFELNGAFAALLEAIGFEVRRLGAHVLFGQVSSMATHMTLEVMLHRPYLVDVGFGDSFIRPLPLDSEGPHDGGVGMYSFRFDGGDITLIDDETEAGAEPQYRFTKRPYLTSEFDKASHRLQTEPGLHWTEGPFATRLLDGGPDRVTLLRNRIKFRSDGFWHEEPVDPKDWNAILDRWFEMTP